MPNVDGFTVKQIQEMLDLYEEIFTSMRQENDPDIEDMNQVVTIIDALTMKLLTAPW